MNHIAVSCGQPFGREKAFQVIVALPQQDKAGGDVVV
jgi:hypothetical protein